MTRSLHGKSTCLLRHQQLDVSVAAASAAVSAAATSGWMYYVYIGGWGGESNREIVFVSFVRACVRSCVCLRDDVASCRWGFGCSKVLRGGVCVAVPLPFVVM